MGKALGITFGLLAAIFAFILFRTGYFKPVQISSGFQGPFVLVYKKHIGPYHKIAPIIDNVEKLVKSKGKECPLAFGRFLHDPKTVPQDRLESHGGCAFPLNDPEVEQLAQDNDLLMDQVEKQEYLVASFDGSPSIGPFKVYPEVESWMGKYGYQIDGPVIEIYQTTGPDSLTTRYLFKYK